jgi:flagellar FliJ protein
MTKTPPIHTLIDLSKMRLDEATRILGNLISGQKVASDRLQLLQDYRTDYRARFMAEAKTGMTRELWRNYQAFLDRLDASITQAEEAVQHSLQRTVLGQREWIGKQDRLRAFDTLAQRHEIRQQHAAHVSEQKAQDEFSARKFNKQDD